MPPRLTTFPRDIARLLVALIATLSILPGFAAPSLSTDKSLYAPDDPLHVTFSGGPANASDWIGIYPQGITPDGDPPSLAWLYTNGTRTAGNGRADGTLTFPPGLGAGDYAAWFLAKDGYAVLAGPVSFRVVSATTAWRVDAIRLRHAVTGVAYTGRIRAYASAPDLRRFRKIAGPAWLQVAANGDLSGTPGPGDSGINTFTIALENAAEDGPAEVPLTIDVCAAGSERVPEITVMSFNSWHEWNAVRDGFEKAVDAIVRSDADLIGLQESSPARAQQMADELGWHRVSGPPGSTQIISRYPVAAIHSVPGIDGARVAAATIRLTSAPSSEVVIFNAHLDYQFYGPYAAHAAGASEASVLAENNRSLRVPQIAAVLAAMAPAIADADRTPVFLTGDFNVPSHLDWTAATASRHVGVGLVTWPESLRVQEAGLVDSFRLLHPDPALTPGDSWSTIHKAGEPQDRIDFVYHRGAGLRAIASDLFATEVQTTVGSWSTTRDPSQLVGGNTWPSDHHAVKTTYRFLTDETPDPPDDTDPPGPEDHESDHLDTVLSKISKSSLKSRKDIGKIIGSPNAARVARKLRGILAAVAKNDALLRQEPNAGRGIAQTSKKTLVLVQRAAHLSKPQARDRTLAAAQQYLRKLDRAIDGALR